MTNNYEKELELAQKNAYSFTGLKPPNDAWYIGSKEKSGDTYHYYKDAEGNYYYDSEKGRKFEEEMLLVQQKKKCRRIA